MTEPATSPLIRLAMWSGPRNISTAMMRAWENRPDCVVSDEPFYAAWLAHTGADHPMRETVIASGQTDPHQVAHQMAYGAPPEDQLTAKPLRIWYQKQMCQHWMDEPGLDWLEPLTHVFLIRDPAKVIASYIKARQTEDITATDVGLPQQHWLFNQVIERTGQVPPVIDGDLFLQNPAGHLRALHQRLNLPDEVDHMLSWPRGPRHSDGVWAPHWYQSVWSTTEFRAPDEHPPVTTETMGDQALAVFEACWPLYEAMKQHAQSLEA